MAKSLLSALCPGFPSPWIIGKVPHHPHSTGDPKRIDHGKCKVAYSWGNEMRGLARSACQLHCIQGAGLRAGTQVLRNSALREEVAFIMPVLSHSEYALVFLLTTSSPRQWFLLANLPSLAPRNTVPRARSCLRRLTQGRTAGRTPHTPPSFSCT